MNTLISTPEELRKILFIQKEVANQAQREMLAFAIHISKSPQTFITMGKKLLAKYANYPTLDEFAADLELANIYKWGATFGIPPLVNGLVLYNAAALQPNFAAVMREAFFSVLMELDSPKYQSLTQAVCTELGVYIHQSNEDLLVPKEPLVQELIGVLVMVGEQFGLMTYSTNQVTLTPTGKRVLLHLAAVHRFTKQAVEAHTAFERE